MADNQATNARADETLDLEKIRLRINQIDQSILELLAERRNTTRKVALSKIENQRAVRDEQREVDLLRKLSQIGANLGLEQQYIGKIFGLIIEDSLAGQKRLLHQHANRTDQNREESVAILGGPGAYSHLAAVAWFGTDNENWQSCSAFAEVVNKVTQGECDFGILPIENTSSGAINESYDLLEAEDVFVVGEEKFNIRHCLISNANYALEQINRVFAHPQAATQCRTFLKNLADTKLETVESSAHALKMIQTHPHEPWAAIAGKEAATWTGLNILASDIADYPHNATRFVIISRQPRAVPLNLPAKVSLVLTTGQHAGALADILQIFKEADIALSKLESRPIPGKAWEQRFYLDLEGNLADPKVSETLDKVAAASHQFRLLGCYVNADLSNTHRSVERATFAT